jgi:hypothetical protein
MNVAILFHFTKTFGLKNPLTHQLINPLTHTPINPLVY